MKVSVSLPDDDVEFLDQYVADHELASRSAAVHKAVRLLRASKLGSAYEQAWAEWGEDPDSAGWETTSADGPA